MLKNPLFLSIAAACGFGIWPVMVRFAKLSPSLTGILVTLATTVGAIIFMGSQAAKSEWSTKGVVICVVAGLLNSLGFVAYSELLSNKEWDLAKYIPLTFGLMIMITALGGIIIFREELTVQKVVGISLVIVSAWLLK